MNGILSFLVALFIILVGTVSVEGQVGDQLASADRRCCSDKEVYEHDIVMTCR